MSTSTAQASPNIAFIKYWGNRDQEQRIPANGSISMNLDGLHTRTQVTFDPALSTDQLTINGHPADGRALERVVALLDRVREMAHIGDRADVESQNNFPAGAGIASSASAFAALSLAATSAAGLDLDEKDLSRLARTGSGSACRSVPEGFVEWLAGTDDSDSYGVSIAPADHWDLTDCIAVVSEAHKRTGSTAGHVLAVTSPLQAARVADASRRLDLCREGILKRDFDALARVTELDSNLMHAVMMSSTPALIYWQPATVEVIRAVPEWRGEGLPAFYTIDAGPNVHVLCPSDAADTVSGRLAALPGVQAVLTATPGGPVHHTG